MSELHIRAARLDDLGEVQDLLRALDTAGDATMPLHAAQMRFMDLTANPDHRIYVAVEGGHIVGTFALVLVGGLAHGGRPQCLVEDVVVAPGRRGHGVGRQMMRFAMQVSASEHCYKLVLSSHLMRDSAHRFYESLGFERHGYSFLIDPAGNTASH